MGLRKNIAFVVGLIAIAALQHVDAHERTWQKADLSGPREGPIVDFKQKIVHLDLKGAPLSISYMESVFPLLRKMGATGLLVEYEDMFPYTGPLANLSALNHYSNDDIKRLLTAAGANNLTVMPLVQTFGHLEFSLKLEEHIFLREVPNNPQAICPSLNDSMQMVREMIRQVADLHKGYITHLHMGSDEVFVIGKCGRCQKRMAANNWTTDDLFLDHALSVAAAVREQGVQPVMWDDMFRKVDLKKIEKFNALTSTVEIMVWQYSDSLSPDIMQAMEKYATLRFSAVWVASAFKGGQNPTNQMPAYESHLHNHISWSLTAKLFENRVNLSGIAITGWQRFDHFTPLCELFPTSVPVLALCLAYLNTGSFGDDVLADIQKQLQCNYPIPLNNPNPPLLSCGYPGAKVYVAVQQFDQIQRKRQSTEAGNYYKAAMTAMNRNHNFGSPTNVNGAITQIPAMQQLVTLVQNNIKVLANVTDNATLQEWIETFLNSEIAWIDGVSQAATAMLSKNSWPRRPLYDEH